MHTGLYNGAVGVEPHHGSKMRLLTLILVPSASSRRSGVWTLFASWLNILGIFVHRLVP